MLETSLNKEKWELTLRSISDRLTHRGPDDSGLWYDTQAGVGLGHRRLSIVDLSPHGHQPMASKSGRYQITYNGEIYNFQELRKDLARRGQHFHGHSDTEVMLAAFEEWGLEEAVNLFVGMFAFGLWDQKEHVLHLVRDRLGIKPLYYGWLGNSFVFGSELKAFKSHPGFQGIIDRNALALMLRHNYIPAPYSIYRGIYKLLPGTILSIRPEDKSCAIPTPTPYWSAREAAKQGAANPLSCSLDEAIACLQNLLRDAVKMRMIADVPLGAFLSGGVDSSTVVALMQAQSEKPVKTFSIGFEDQSYNEAEHAKAVAAYLGTDHTELYVSPEKAMAVIPKIPTIFDEPFSDSSQIPTFLVSDLARRHVTVCLSGDGGDELFCGYKRYVTGLELWQKFGWIPPWGRRALSGLIALTPVKVLDGGPGWLAPKFSKYGKYGRDGFLGDKIRKIAEILPADNPETIYRNLISHWKKPAEVVIGAAEPLTVFTESSPLSDLPDFGRKMMFLDTVSYLPDDILTKVDRASMAVSLEARVPLLDHRVVEFAWRMPVSMKIRCGQQKWILRQIAYHYIPKKLIDRPKMGFGIPLDQWLREPLRDWAESLLNESRLCREGFFNPAPVRQKWEEHLSGQRNWHYYLWDVLMFQAWLEEERRGQ